MKVRWAAADSDIGRFVDAHSSQSLEAYRAQPSLIEEHFRIEEGVLTGGYSHRQLYELIQNAADALTEAGCSGRVRVILTDSALYCANEGAPIDREGARAILMAHLSQKGGDQIGHFGLGFKSVLNVTKSPEFFSRSGSFGFSEAWARARLTEIASNVPNIPVLRLADVLDPAASSDRDPILKELMEWATTVVRLPRNAGGSSWLSDELSTFPAQFLLFSRQIRELVLEDRTNGHIRKMTVRAKSESLVLDDGKQRTAWRVFRTDVLTKGLSAAAREDDARARDRTSLPVLWAVPSKVGRDKNLFWAFFPTETETTLSGILNAPWKTNADRLNLLEGPYNLALLDIVICMVIEHLTTLAAPEDPGVVLDLLPARSRDAKNWADRYIADGLEARLRIARCIPTSSGTFAIPTEVKLRPDEVLQEPVQAWLLEHGRPERDGQWCNRSVEQRERRARAERMGVLKASWSEWLQALSAALSISSVKAALDLVRAAWPGLSQGTRDQIRGSPFILTESGDRQAADTKLYLPGRFPVSGAAVHFVHNSLAKDPNSKAALGILGVGSFGDEAELELLMAAGSVDWMQVWGLAHSLARDSAVRVLVKHQESLRLRTRTDVFQPIFSVFLPGPIVAVEDKSDDNVAVDTRFHSDLGLLHAVGAASAPVEGWTVNPDEPWFRSYLAASRSYYSRANAAVPAEAVDRMQFGETATIGPLGPLMWLTDRARARMVEYLLPYLLRERPWTLQHTPQKNRYKRFASPGPIHWMIREHGFLYTSSGVQRTKASVAPVLHEWQLFLPVASCSDEVARELQLARTLTGLAQETWHAALTACLKSDDLETVARFYAAAAEHIPWPHVILCAVGTSLDVRPPRMVTVVDDRARCDALRSAGIPVIRVNTAAEADALVSSWGLQKVDARVSIVDEQSSEPLLDMFPGLVVWSTETVGAVNVRKCSELWIEVSGADGSRRFPVSIARQGNDVCCSESENDREVLTWIDTEFDLRLPAHVIEDLAGTSETEARRALLSRIAVVSEPVEKLAIALGDRLIRHLPTSVIESVADSKWKLSALAAAETALAVFGVEVLKQYEAELSEAGLAPPRQWNGSARALDFVEQLGLPAEYAGFEAPSRAPMLEVDGPIALPPLHAFQEEIANRIREFVRKPGRGLLSLPTGSGKTRVVVEALIRADSDERLSGPIVWIAQSDELCEQAVQAWGQAWRALGPVRRLRISRLWGATNNRVRPSDDAHVVVATYQTLINRVDRPDFAWLLQPSCVVVDEAHESMGSSYTEILSAFGFSSAKETPRPLIGLSATPFRGAADETETRRLVNRYGGYRFDHGVMRDDDPYAYLQSMGVLARVEHQLLAGTEMSLSEAELDDLRRFNKLPAAVEGRLGLDVTRNEALIDSILGLPPDWPVLLFAASVDHAGLIASHLSLKGVSARAVSAETDIGARRFYVDEFKAGRIRVLTNYGVLATGFDAPAIRALYIARPVYSRVAYQQMIGRGLRGPLNGGKTICTIINVADNLGEYGEKLAFRHFEHLWKPEGLG